MIVRALFDRAKGYSHEVSRTTLYRGKEQTVTNTASYPPDTQARLFWLRNRQREYGWARAGVGARAEGVDPPGGGAQCRRRERAPCRRVRGLTWQTLAETAEIVEATLSCRQRHRASAAAIVPP